MPGLSVLGPLLLKSTIGFDAARGFASTRRTAGLAPVARRLPERDEANLLLVVPTHYRRTVAVSVVIDEDDSLAAQPELFAGVKSIVSHKFPRRCRPQP